MADRKDGAQGMRGWLKVVLFASLALNLAVVGIVAGMVLRGPPDGERHGARRDPVTPYTRAFTEPQRDALRTKLRDGFRDRPRDGGAFIDDYRAAMELIKNDPYDSAAMAELLEQQATRTDGRRQHGQRVLNGYLAALSPAERAAYADRLAEEITKLEQRRARWQRK